MEIKTFDFIASKGLTQAEIHSHALMKARFFADPSPFTHSNSRCSVIKQIPAGNNNCQYTVTLSLFSSPQPTSLALSLNVSPATPQRPTGSLESSSAYKELQRMIGLDVVKKQILDLGYLIQLQQRRKRDLAIPLHIAFLGNPGTGKTVVARLYGRLLHELGVLPTTTFCECTKADLTSQYWNESMRLTQAAVQRAIGGVLFIDEAHTLVMDSGSSKDVCGRESLSALNKLMEDRRGEFVVVMAGYEDAFNKLLLAEPGLNSRLCDPILFPDYRDNELLLLLEDLIHQEGFRLAKNEKLKELLVRTIASQRDKVGSQAFGNARGLRKIMSSIKYIHARHTKLHADEHDDIISIRTIEALAST